MTTNQTIDGVPRELLERIRHKMVVIQHYDVAAELSDLLGDGYEICVLCGKTPAGCNGKALKVNGKFVCAPPNAQEIRARELRAPLHAEPFTRPTEIRQGVVLPERKPMHGSHAEGWNACLDELKRLNSSL